MPPSRGELRSPWTATSISPRDLSSIGTKFLPSKAHPKSLYLSPDYPLTRQQRRMFRWIAIMSHARKPHFSALADAVLKHKLPPDQFAQQVADKLLRETNTRGQKSRLASGPRCHGHRLAQKVADWLIKFYLAIMLRKVRNCRP